MSVRLMVLGVVSQKGETHGYDIYRELTLWKAETWSAVRSGSIYHAVAQLEKEGLIQQKGRQKSTDGPAKTSYAVTPQGEVALTKLIKQALVSFEQETFTTGLAFMHRLPRRVVIQLAQERLKKYMQTADFMSSLPKETNPTTPATHPEIIDSWATVFVATRDWQRHFIERLQSGKYTFSDE